MNPTLTIGEWLTLAGVLVAAAGLLFGIWKKWRDVESKKKARTCAANTKKLEATQKFLLTFVASVEKPGARHPPTEPTEFADLDPPLIGDSLLYEEWLAAVVAAPDYDRLDALKRRINSAFLAQRERVQRNQAPRRANLDTASIRELKREFKRHMDERRKRLGQGTAGDYGLRP